LRRQILEKIASQKENCRHIVGGKVGEKRKLPNPNKCNLMVRRERVKDRKTIGKGNSTEQRTKSTHTEAPSSSWRHQNKRKKKTLREGR